MFANGAMDIFSNIITLADTDDLFVHLQVLAGGVVCNDLAN